MAQLVTLTTDFGLRDPYVGMMEGVIAGIAPEARVVHLTHGVPSYDVRFAAFVLAGSYRYFPAGSVHVAVVDPGVGSARAAMAAAVNGHFFVGPDNGVFASVYGDHVVEAVELSRDVGLESVSSTFHGRDLFAPAAARLAYDGSLARLGQPRASDHLVRDWPAARSVVSPQGVTVSGEILAIDRFGNAISNIAPERSGGRVVFRPMRRSDLELPVRDHYAEVERGDVLALIGSYGYLELSVREGHAAERFGIEVGDALEWRVDRLSEGE